MSTDAARQGGSRRPNANVRVPCRPEGGTCCRGVKGKQLETKAAPIRYVAELLGTDTDSERAIRWLIALMVLTCDPLAIALTAAASARS